MSLSSATPAPLRYNTSSHCDELTHAFDNIFCVPRGNGPVETTEADSFHYEKAILEDVPTGTISLVDEKKLVLISNDGIKNMKVDVWKTELYQRGIFTSGNEAELLEKLRNSKRNTFGTRGNNFSGTTRQ